MTDTTSVERRWLWGASGYSDGHWVRATDYDALAAKLAEVEAERDEARKIADHDKELWLAAEARAEAAEAALVAAYRLGVRDGATHIFSMENDGSKPQWIHQGSWAHTIEQASHRARQTPTPTAEELMARIKEKNDD